MITGRNFAESYYEDERLYSTGDYELDELLERAFCEGYEYAQREFNTAGAKQLTSNYFKNLGKQRVIKEGYSELAKSTSPANQRWLKIGGREEAHRVTDPLQRKVNAQRRGDFNLKSHLMYRGFGK